MPLKFRKLDAGAWEDISEQNFADLLATSLDAPQQLGEPHEREISQAASHLHQAVATAFGHPGRAGQDATKPALWVDWRLEDTPNSEVDGKVRFERTSADSKRLAELLGVHEVYLQRPHWLAGAYPRFYIDHLGAPRLTTIGFNAFYEIGMLQKDLAAIELQLQRTSFEVVVQFCRGVLITASPKGCGDLFVGNDVTEYRRSDHCDISSRGPFMATVLLRSVFRMDGLIEGLHNSLQYELLPSSETQSEASIIKKLELIKKMLRLRHDFDRQIDAVERFIAFWRGARSESVVLASVMGSLDVDLGRWKKLLAQNAESLKLAADTSIAEMEARRAAADQYWAHQFSLLERAVLPLIVWSTFWGVNFAFFEDVVDGLQVPHSRRIMDLGFVQVPEWWVFWGSLLLVFPIIWLGLRVAGTRARR